MVEKLVEKLIATMSSFVEYKGFVKKAYIPH